MSISYIVVDCGPDFGTLGNGTVDDEEGTTFGSRVEFTCNRGFTGNQFRQCLANGSWSGTVPTCSSKCTCDRISLPLSLTSLPTSPSPHFRVLQCNSCCMRGVGWGVGAGVPVLPPIPIAPHKPARGFINLIGAYHHKLATMRMEYQ